MRPTLWPSFTRASARFTATVVLPTPPLPLATATRFFTPGMGWRSGCCIGAGGMWLPCLDAEIEERFLDCAGRRFAGAKRKRNSACSARNDNSFIRAARIFVHRRLVVLQQLRICAVAFFVLFAGAAGARVVAAHFCAGAGRCGRFGLRGAGLILQLFLLALLLALHFAGEGWQALWRRVIRPRCGAGVRPGRSPH